MAMGQARPDDDTAHAPRRRRAVVHIGLNKTGSNAIHTWLSRNAEALRRKGFWFDSLAPHGGPEFSTATGWVAYARAVRPDWMPGPHERQIFRLATRADLDARIDTFLARVDATLPAQGGTYVTSAEMIGGLLSPKVIERLHDWFAQRFESVRYIVYLRDQVDWVASAYGQAIRAGETLGLDAFIDREGANDYFALVRRWQGVVGADALDVRLYGGTEFAGGDLIEDFAAALGTDTTQTTIPPRRNQATSVARLNWMRRVSRVFGPAFSKAGLLGLQRRLFALRMPRLGTSPKLTLTPDQAARVRAMNAETNARLCAQHFPGRTELFRNPSLRNASPVPYTELSKVTGN